ncbi:MAG: glycerol kinase GlpK [Candidatus Eremiobacteraeota bacterium]|nr:glycerol kinase GlpK [Candidatus Eremiobacteraeota bacterium]
MSYILALDQGTSSSRALLFDSKGEVVALAQKEFTQHYPKPGWVEHDPIEIWDTQLEVARKALAEVGANPDQIKAIGITNQRETTVMWDRKTGEPVFNAIVWQDRRTSDLCKSWKTHFGAEITSKTGLVVDAYFSASKVAWLLDNVDGLRARAEAGEIAFGTIDSWLIWKLTEGRVHVTDTSNASRTMLYNIEHLQWDNEILKELNIPSEVLPKVVGSSEVVGATSLFGGSSIPIAGIAGDQQSALFGQRCFQAGMSKNTYGTGCFMLLNTGKERRYSNNQLLSTIAWTIGKETTYALEGSVFIGGAAVGWLRDGLEMIDSSSDVEALAEQVEDNGGVYFVPAFNGLGTPHWDQDARGLIIGLTRGSTRAHIARATLESIAFQVADLATAMEKDSGLELTQLRVDGGAANNNLMLQFQSDLLQAPVVRPRNTETTALGAALLAGLAVGFYPDMASLSAQENPDRVFEPAKDPGEVKAQRSQWNRAVERSKAWSMED